MRLVLMASSAVALFVFACGGCTVVTGAPGTTEATYKKLGQWQNQAKGLADKGDYPVVQREVNVWIEAKAKAVELASGQYFAQVDLTPDKALEDEVNAFLNKHKADVRTAGVVEDLAKAFFDWVVGEYKKGRTAEGATTSAGLKDYEWPKPATRPAAF